MTRPYCHQNFTEVGIPSALLIEEKMPHFDQTIMIWFDVPLSFFFALSVCRQVHLKNALTSFRRPPQNYGVSQSLLLPWVMNGPDS